MSQVDCFIGEIRMVGFTRIPRGWAMCDGSLISISENPALFSLLGTNFGGDGRTTFGLPHFRGRVPVGSGQGIGTSFYRMGEIGGFEGYKLLESQMPVHSHTATVSAQGATLSGQATAKMYVNNDSSDGSSPQGKYLGVEGGGSGLYADAKGTGNPTLATDAISVDTTNMSVAINDLSVGIGNSGGTDAITIVQPFQAVMFIIALDGIFPSPN